jgi:hypothetical protein
MYSICTFIVTSSIRMTAPESLVVQRIYRYVDVAAVRQQQVFLDVGDVVADRFLDLVQCNRQVPVNVVQLASHGLRRRGFGGLLGGAVPVRDDAGGRDADQNRRHRVDDGLDVVLRIAQQVLGGFVLGDLFVKLVVDRAQLFRAIVDALFKIALRLLEQPFGELVATPVPQQDGDQHHLHADDQAQNNGQQHGSGICPAAEKVSCEA